MKNFPLFAAVCLLGAFCAGPSAAQQSNQGKMPPDAISSGGPAAGQAAVDVWLAVVDDGQYHRGWDIASSLFKNSVNEPTWTTLMNGHRAPLGKMLSRKLVSANFAPALPGAPAGKYVVVIYAASFEHKKTAVETITAVLDVDGQWKVSGYMVK